MRYYAALILALLGMACNNANEPSTQTTEVKKDSLKAQNKIDTNSHLSTDDKSYMEKVNLFTGKFKVTYYDNTSKNIVIDSIGNIKGSKNYKLFRVVINEQKDYIYLVKGSDEKTSAKDTFNYIQVDKNIKCYLINNHQNKYTFTLTKITQ